jgi:hypothetical protein
MVRQAYVIPGVVDEAVLRKQALKRANPGKHDKQAPEQTAIHKHKQGKRCNESCYLVKIGEHE